MFISPFRRRRRRPPDASRPGAPPSASSLPKKVSFRWFGRLTNIGFLLFFLQCLYWLQSSTVSPAPTIVPRNYFSVNETDWRESLDRLLVYQFRKSLLQRRPTVPNNQTTFRTVLEQELRRAGYREEEESTARDTEPTKKKKKKTPLERFLRAVLANAHQRLLTTVSTHDDTTLADTSFRHAHTRAYVRRHAEACRGKAGLVDIVLNSLSPDSSDAFVHRPFVLPRTNLRFHEPTLCQVLPTLSQIIKLYPHGPIVRGLDRCQDYQDHMKHLQPYIQNAITQTNASVRYGPRVGGLYHSGTNALARTLELNLVTPDRVAKFDSPWDVPWGKHVPSRYRLQNVFPPNNPDSPRTVLPVILIRDPYRWMSQMCKDSYDALFVKHKIGCPRLIIDHNTTNSVVVKTNQMPSHVDKHATLADLWSNWNKEYLDAPYPRLMVRFEDFLLYAPEIFRVIRLCAGVKSIHDEPDKFVYQAKEARSWSNKGSLLHALSALGDADPYYQTVGGPDQEYLRQQGLDDDLMKIFHYPRLSNETRPARMHVAWRQKQSPRQLEIDQLLKIPVARRDHLQKEDTRHNLMKSIAMKVG